MQPADPRLADLVQAGKIRVALFLPQYTKDSASGELRGLGTGFVAVEIARELAARLGVEAVFVENPTPPKAVECLKTGTCDIAFLGIEASRATEIDFSPPIIQFDYTCLVPAGSSIRSFSDADRPDVRIAVVRNHASTFTLSRILKHAAAIGSELPDAAFDLLRTGKVEAFALPREQLRDYSAKLPGSRVLDDSYGVNRVAIAVSKGRAGWLAAISQFIAAMKASGLVQRAIERGGLRGFEVVPPEQPN